MVDNTAPKPTTIRLDWETKRALQSLAAGMQLSEAEVIRFLIREKHSQLRSSGGKYSYIPGKDK